MSLRPAQIVAHKLEVHCPYCGEPQPSPDDGSDVWTPEEVRASESRRECVACDKTFLLSLTTKAKVPPCSAELMNVL